jgi:hypothetical protein
MHVVADLGLRDSDHEPTQQGETERAKAAQERGGQRVGDQRRDAEHAELGDRRHQDPRDAGQAGSERPGGGRHQLRRPALSGGTLLVLGDGRRHPADPGAVPDDAQDRGRDDRDGQQPQLVRGDRRAEDGDGILGEQGPDDDQVLAPDDHRQRLQDEEDPQGGDQASQRRGPAQATHDQLIGRQATERDDRH